MEEGPNGLPRMLILVPLCAESGDGHSIFGVLYSDSRFLVRCDAISAMVAGKLVQAS
jgi:hypothetical protein